ncbi:MAG: Rpn family recombination-promoting nuclease/putative transposase, partial [Candidatus Eremiobacterota bacterium]
MDKDKFSDRGYKLLFSHPKMVEDLIKSFVKEEFIDKIDYSTLKPVKSSFVSSGFKSRETDVIWTLKIDGKEAYVYILIDFQSTVDKFMALRLMTYTGLFYEYLLKQKKKKKKKLPDKLPPVFPVLLYNGTKKWSAPLNINELIDISFPSLRKYIPQFCYYKIEETDFTRESLLEIENLVSRLFLIELSKIEELADIIEDTINILKKEVNKELQRDFGLWIRGILGKKHFNIDLNKLDEMEVRPMLLETLDKFE